MVASRSHQYKKEMSMRADRFLVRTGLITATMFLAAEVQSTSRVLATPPASTLPGSDVVLPSDAPGAGASADTADDVSDLRAQMKKVIAHDQELEAKVARLEAAQAATQPSAADTTAAIAQALHDSDLHTHLALMTSDSEAGWDPNKGI